MALSETLSKEKILQYISNISNAEVAIALGRFKLMLELVEKQVQEEEDFLKLSSWYCGTSACVIGTCALSYEFNLLGLKLKNMGFDSCRPYIDYPNISGNTFIYHFFMDVKGILLPEIIYNSSYTKKETNEDGEAIPSFVIARIALVIKTIEESGYARRINEDVGFAYITKESWSFIEEVHNVMPNRSIDSIIFTVGGILKNVGMFAAL